MLKPWRSVAIPNQDVLQGSYQDAEFAAKLGQVVAKEGHDDYHNPITFFQNTFITEGMNLLLANVITRLAGQGGDPVIQLQTPFGGGKTHTMIAAYHVATASVEHLPGIENILTKLGVTQLPNVHIAVLDGIALSPSHPRTVHKTVINTLWGEIAWQLGGEAGYARVAASDQQGTSPGKNILSQLFKQYAPTMILMDEMVAYLRQFAANQTYAGGTFESNLSFLQALTEAASEEWLRLSRILT